MTDKTAIVRRSIVIPPSGQMSIKQAADHIGSCVSYLEKNPDRPMETRIGKKKSFHVDDVNQWLDERGAAKIIFAFGGPYNDLLGAPTPARNVRLVPAF